MGTKEIGGGAHLRRRTSSGLLFGVSVLVSSLAAGYWDEDAGALALASLVLCSLDEGAYYKQQSTITKLLGLFG